MKKIMLTLGVLLLELVANAQNYTVRHDANTRAKIEARDSTIRNQAMRYDPHQFKAGELLQSSARYDALSWGLAIASALCYTGANDKNRKICNLFGTVLGITAIASKVCSVSFKNKAGTELQLSAGAIKVTF